MDNLKLEEWDDLLDFAQSYIGCAIVMINRYGQKPEFKTFKKYDRAYVLSAHLLMAHGVELYLKFLILLLRCEPKQTHALKCLMSDLKSLYCEFSERPIIEEGLEEEVNTLDKYDKFRYPLDHNWKRIPDIIDEESKKWTNEYARSSAGKWTQIMEQLNATGYRLSERIKNNHDILEKIKKHGNCKNFNKE